MGIMMGKCKQPVDWAALQDHEEQNQVSVDPTQFFGCEPDAPYGNAAFAEDNMCVADEELECEAPADLLADGPGEMCEVPASQLELDRILAEYQVEDDDMTSWSPSWVGWLVDSVQMTETEGGLLDQLQTRRGLSGLSEFKDIRDDAFSVATGQYEDQDGTLDNARLQDGHRDAYRHMYWNARLTREFGAEFTTAFTTAHEGVPGNPADREAMDLYNNEMGRNIATNNPDATEEELQALIREAVDDGMAVVIDSNGELAFSNTVEPGEHGNADDAPMGGGQAPPEWNTSTDSN